MFSKESEFLMKHIFLGFLTLTIILTLTPLPTSAADQPNQKDSSQSTDALSKEGYVDRVIDEVWADTDPSGKEQKAPKTKEELDKMHKEQEETASDLLLY